MRKTIECSEMVQMKLPKRAKLTEEETLKRLASFDERKERTIGSVRKRKG